mmetsp:Transcript_55890/g.86919  ORF Transcript_55890/g.86919 Transcript_55890/m.86919 type:complete len:100 (-) Transcript_55890:556-855(-)
MVQSFLQMEYSPLKVVPSHTDADKLTIGTSSSHLLLIGMLSSHGIGLLGQLTLEAIKLADLGSEPPPLPLPSLTRVWLRAFTLLRLLEVTSCDVLVMLP